MLRLSPNWVKWAYRVLVGFALAALVYLCVARMNEYASGAAVVRATSRTDVICRVPATVEQVTVVPGERVRAGRILVRLGGGEEPVLAPVDGVVSQILCRPGEEIPAGQAAITLAAADSAFTVHAALPGRTRPRLRPGQSARFEPTGYERSTLPVTISTVADDVVHPHEALRFLGQDLTEAKSGSGSLVFVTASLEGDDFVAEGRRHRYADGLPGTLEVRVRSVPIIVDLVPGLRRFWESRDHVSSD